MEEYLDKLLSQIRCKKARPYISDEVRGHIEDQIRDNISNGMTAKEAEINAVADMGDPVETGISLDRIHKPRIAWKLIVIVGILSLLGIVIQQSIGCDPWHDSGSEYRFLISVLMGFAIMCGIYFFDYTAIAKYSRLIGTFIIGIGVLGNLGFFVVYDGVYGIKMVITLSLTSIMLFYVPVYGAILYKYRNGGTAALLKAVIWLLVPVIVAFRIPSIVATAVLLVSMLIQLSAAILKGWFKVPVKKTLAILWAAFGIAPVIMIFVMYAFHMLAAYQEARLQAWLTASDSYLLNIYKLHFQDIVWIGSNGRNVSEMIPGASSYNVFLYILLNYGRLAGMLIIAALAVLIMFVFSVCLKQKNELGMVMGFGCGMVILLNTVINLLSVIGVIPPAATFIPFISRGSEIVLSYALVGIIMSVYRYKDVYPKHVKTQGKTFQIKFTIGL